MNFRTLYGEQFMDEDPNSVFYEQIVTIVPYPKQHKNMDKDYMIWIEGDTYRGREAFWQSKTDNLKPLSGATKILYGKK